MKTYAGTKQNEGIGAQVVTVNGKRLWNECQSICNHSPDGFNWGYAGSGPAQLALAILFDYFGDARKAEILHQAFKFAFVSRFKDNWELTGDEIEAWLAENKGEFDKQLGED